MFKQTNKKAGNFTQVSRTGDTKAGHKNAIFAPFCLISSARARKDARPAAAIKDDARPNGIRNGWP